MLQMHESGDLLSVIADAAANCRKGTLCAKNGCDSHLDCRSFFVLFVGIAVKKVY